MKSVVAKLVQTLKLFCAVGIVVLRTRELRRKLMFIVSILAMGMTFLGMVVLDAFLTERVALFLAYWVICSGLVVLMLMLALYDIARLRADAGGEAVRRLGEVFHDLETPGTADGGPGEDGVAGEGERPAKASDDPTIEKQC